MLKKITLLFLFISMFSLQAIIDHPFFSLCQANLHPIQPFDVPKFLNINNAIQESYNHTIAIFSQIPGRAKFLPKKPISDELTQLQYMTLLNAIYRFSYIGMVTVAFYDNIQTVQPIKKAFEKIKNGYLIAIDIHKNQAIKNVFNITKPTIIYYYECEEIARSTNFDSNNVLRYVKNNASFEYGREGISRLIEIKNALRWSYNEWICIFSHNNYSIAKLLPKQSITQELTQARFLALLGAIRCHSTLGTVIIVFYNSSQKIESLKNIVEQQKHISLIVADINKTEQEIKDIFNVTEPTVIYYSDSEEVARSINFDINNIVQYIKNIPPPAYEPITFRSCKKKFGIIVVAFFNNAQKIENLNNLFEQQKSACLIRGDINNTEQKIKNFFNITTEPTIIYYKNGVEIARSTNFSSQEVLRHITTI